MRTRKHICRRLHAWSAPLSHSKPCATAHAHAPNGSILGARGNKRRCASPARVEGPAREFECSLLSKAARSGGGGELAKNTTRWLTRNHTRAWVATMRGRSRKRRCLSLEAFADSARCAFANVSAFFASGIPRVGLRLACSSPPRHGSVRRALAARDERERVAASPEAHLPRRASNRCANPFRNATPRRDGQPKLNKFTEP